MGTERLQQCYKIMHTSCCVRSRSGLSTNTASCLVLLLLASLATPISAALMTEAEIESKLAGVYKTTEGVKKIRSLIDEMMLKNQQTCTAISTNWGKAGCTSSTTCDSSDEKTACCDGTEVKTSCDDAPDDWKKENNGDQANDNTDCCDICVTKPDDKTSDAYKLYEDRCVGEVGLSGRITVCNKLVYSKDGEEHEKVIAGAPIAYQTDCSTEGTLVLKPEEEEDDSGEGTGVTRCGMTSAEFTKAIDCFTDSNKLKSTSVTSFDTDKNNLAQDEKAAVEKVFSGMPVFLLLGATVASKDYDDLDLPDGASKQSYEKAKISVPGTLDTNENSCQVAIAKPHLNADLEMQGYDAFVYDPTTYAGNTITFAGSSSATVVNGKSAADINATTSGAVVIHNVENSGKLDAAGLKGALLSSIKNSGTVTLTNVEGNAVYIDNTADGTVDIQGTSTISVQFCRQKGTVTFGDDVKGTVYIPVGHTVPKVPSGIKLNMAPDHGCLNGPKGPWSDWSTCSCDNTDDIVRTRTVGEGTQSETKPCTLETECPGVAGAAPARVEMALTGDGLWDWVNENMAVFKSSMATDVAATLNIAKDKVHDVVATRADSLLLLAPPARLGLLADQTIDVAFVLASGASKALTPLQLAESFQRAVNNGTTNFSSTQAASGIVFTAEVTGVGATTAVGQGTVGIIFLVAIVVVPVLALIIICIVCRKWCCKSSKTTNEVQTTTPDKQASSGSP